MKPKNIQFASSKLRSLTERGIIPNNNQDLYITNRLVISLRGAKSRFISQQQIDHTLIIPELFQEQEIQPTNVLELMNILEIEIEQLVGLIKNSIDAKGVVPEDTLKLLALKISFWGGKMSLSGAKNKEEIKHYLINPNFDWSLYLKLIKLILTLNYDKPDFKSINAVMNEIDKFGPSFLTKVFHFFTKNIAPSFQLPIYDSIIAKKWFNKNQVNFSDYLEYYNWVKEKSIQFKISNHDFERFLFNHAED